MSACAHTRPRRGWAEVALLALVAFVAKASAGPADVMTVDGRRPQGAMVTVGETRPDLSADAAEVERTLAGVLATYDRKAVRTLLRCVTGHTPPDDADGTREAVVHLYGQGDQVRRIEITRLADGRWMARDLKQPDQSALLDRSRIEALVATWPSYRGRFGDDAVVDPLGTSFELPPPYIAGAITMDRRTMTERLYRGLNVEVEDADRVLAGETLHARLPAGYDPLTPAGLLVWSSPSPDGRVPAVFGRALDELGIVCVGIDAAGNDRDVPDKFQLVFDAVATASRRYRIDPERVYIAGLSGGGKVASILTITFPDVFAGALPIVGFASYSQLDQATWGRHHMAYFTQPGGSRIQLARTRPMALMGGPPDFNYAEMEERRRLLEIDGFERVRFFAYPDMAHHLPTPERFAEALRWVVQQ